MVADAAAVVAMNRLRVIFLRVICVSSFAGLVTQDLTRA
jgi:hypothetical protein